MEHGEEELIHQIPRKISIQCISSTGILYILNKEEFHKRIVNDEKTMEVLAEQFRSKALWFNERIKKYIRTAREMQISNDKTMNLSIERPENVEDFMLPVEKPRNIKKKTDIRADFSKGLMEIQKTLKKDKINHFLSKSIKKSDCEKIKKNLKSHENFEKKTEFRHKKAALSLNSFINMPIEKENIINYFMNKEFDEIKTPKLNNLRKFDGLRCKTSVTIGGVKNLKTENFSNEFFEFEKNAEKFDDLPLKYQSEKIKSKAKKSLKKIMMAGVPKNLIFLKTISCFTMNSKE